MDRSMFFDGGNWTVGPRGKGRGFVPVTTRFCGGEVGIPLMVVRGSGGGPVLVVSGGIHGDEYEGGEAIRRCWRELDPSGLRGTFVGVPAVNMPAQEIGGRSGPGDHIDLNRVFPGRADGFLTERIAHVFFHEVVRKADCLLDLHAGGGPFAMLPMTVFLDEGAPDLRQRVHALARTTGTEHLWRGQGRWSSAHVAAVRSGIPAVLVEVGGEGRCREEHVDFAARIIRNVMCHLGMLAGSPLLPARRMVVQGTYRHAGCGGLFRPLVGIGARVRAGQPVGVISDVFGDVREQVNSPSDGIVCSTRTLPSVRPGDWTVFVGQVVAEEHSSPGKELEDD